MSNFERKFGKYAIRNISMVLIMCYALGYAIELLMPGLLYYLTLNPYAVLHGQIWRLVGADTAGNIQSVFYIAYALFLLFAWNDAGKNMGNIPI